MIKTPQIKYVIWDWNGTLINDSWLFVELMNDELRLRHLPEITVEEMCAEMVAHDLGKAKQHALLKQHGYSVAVAKE